MKWLDYEGAQPRPQVIKYMREIIAKIDGGEGPGDSTMKNWANEALTRLQRQRGTIGQPLSGPGK